VLGALLGDGCLYRWKITNNYTILAGDNKFTTKYAARLSLCISRKAKPYINRSNNIWFVRANNYALYSLFERARNDIHYLQNMVQEAGDVSSLLFVEGFFDAEGCVKIIKEKVRITPKICLDITNTNYEFLEIVRKILEEKLNIVARYSIQKASPPKNRRVAYHLRIYKKEYVKRFFENISTTKLGEEKTVLLNNWLR